jgi:hypothetical protein
MTSPSGLHVAGRLVSFESATSIRGWVIGFSTF